MRPTVVAEPQAAAHRRRVRDHGVADAVPHAGDAGAAAARRCRAGHTSRVSRSARSSRASRIGRSCRDGIERCRALLRRLPRRAQRRRFGRGQAASRRAAGGSAWRRRDQRVAWQLERAGSAAGRGSSIRLAEQRSRARQPRNAPATLAGVWIARSVPARGADPARPPRMDGNAVRDRRGLMTEAPVGRR